MNKKFQVIWAKTAVEDLEDIVNYIAQNSPLTAQKLLKQIKDKVESLSFSPSRGRHVPELQEQGILAYRELIVAPWRIMYRIAKDKVYVLTIIDCRRNVEDILFHKLIKKKL